NFFIADGGNAVREVTVSTGNITRVAGDGTACWHPELYTCGDGGPATSAHVSPVALALDGGGNLYITSRADQKIKRVASIGTGGLMGGALLPAEALGTNPAERWCSCTQGKKADPVDTATGNFSETYTDLAIPGRGMPLAFSRTYNSYPGQTVPNGPL